MLQIDIIGIQELSPRRIKPWYLDLSIQRIGITWFYKPRSLRLERPYVQGVLPRPVSVLSTDPMFCAALVQNLREGRVTGSPTVRVELNLLP